jgi:hypothetical protein
MPCRAGRRAPCWRSGFLGSAYTLLIGTVTAWLGEAHVNLATIGVLSWIGLAYSFKFLWSPLVDRLSLPGIGVLGRRKGWILGCQIVLVAALAGLAVTDPAVGSGVCPDRLLSRRWLRRRRTLRSMPGGSMSPTKRPRSNCCRRCISSDTAWRRWSVEPLRCSWPRGWPGRWFSG